MKPISTTQIHSHFSPSLARIKPRLRAARTGPMPGDRSLERRGGYGECTYCDVTSSLTGWWTHVQCRAVFFVNSSDKQESSCQSSTDFFSALTTECFVSTRSINRTRDRTSAPRTTAWARRILWRMWSWSVSLPNWNYRNQGGARRI